MGRTIGPKNKIARRFGVHLGLKSNPSKVARRLSQLPGVHGPKKRRPTLSSFGKQLAEKQKAKAVFGIREQQFRRYAKEAARKKGDSGVMLNQLLESRLDNVVYRLGFAITRAQARQFVTHGLFMVNGKKMDIPSYIVKNGDVISVKENKAKKKIFQDITDRLHAHQPSSWLTLDAVKQTGTVIGTPLPEDFEKVFDVQLIIEYYATR